MIQQTLFLSFTPPTSPEEVAFALGTIEAAVLAAGVGATVSSRPHLPVAGEDRYPAFIGSAVVQLGVADLAALGALFAASEVDAAFDAIRTRHPFSTAWVNHEPLA